MLVNDPVPEGDKFNSRGQRPGSWKDFFELETSLTGGVAPAIEFVPFRGRSQLTAHSMLLK